MSEQTELKAKRTKTVCLLVWKWACMEMGHVWRWDICGGWLCGDGAWSQSSVLGAIRYMETYSSNGFIVALWAPQQTPGLSLHRD